MKQQTIPEHAVCRSFGCGKKATTVIKDSKGRRQYCCPKHDGSQRIKENKRATQRLAA